MAEIESLPLETLQLDWLLAISLESWTGQTVDALEPLWARHAIPERELLQMRYRNHTYRHQVESLAHRLKFLGVADDELDRLRRLDLSSTTESLRTHTRLPLRAPADGLIADLHIDLGQVVRPNDQLFEIQNLDRVWIQANLIESDAALIRLGQPATVEITADPDFSAHGVVTRISPELSAASHVLPVWVELANSDHHLKEGMSARVRFDVRSQQQPQESDAEK